MASTKIPDTSHNADFALQKYLLLHSEHESLVQHLDEIRPSLSTHSAVSSPTTSPTRTYQSSSPARCRHHSASWTYPGLATTADPLRRNAPYLETVMDKQKLHELAAGEQQLFDVNEGIKRMLTELLNCEPVRKDKALRTMVQCRLMETEKELRSRRRRRSGPGVE